MVYCKRKEKNQYLSCIDLFVNVMRFFLNKLIINGAKNIDKPIELLFSNKTISENMNFINSNVKAIYGPNGSGKSGIMAAMYIYKRLIEDVDGINDKFFARFIFETINKDIKCLSIDVIFTAIDFFDNNKPCCFKHCVELGVDDEIVSIKKEEVSILKGKSIKNENFKIVISIENGELKYIKSRKSELHEEPLYISSLNLLDKHSIASSLLKLINNYNDYYSTDIDVIESLMSILMFSSNLIVELNKEDIHFDYISNRIREKKYDSEEKISDFFKKYVNELSPSEYLIKLSTKNRDIVDEKDYSKYEQNITGLSEFIKLFKPDLDEIIIDRKINDDKIYCDKIFRYGNKKINVEFESTGIKKLVKLYSTLKNCANGSIAFVDEMDANLHDVYFAKIIEFLKNDSKGQLCFTTHNLEPIDVLKDNSHSLDFISNDSRVYSWIKDGNKSPMSKYINGLIPYSPFNIEAFDFDLLLDEE